MNKQVAEFIGTFTLVLLGCGSAVLAGADIGLTGISFAFGLALIGMAYGIGPVLGCHINPAVSLGMVAAGRMSMPEAVKYIIAQVAGGNRFCSCSLVHRNWQSWLHIGGKRFGSKRLGRRLLG